MPKLDIEKIKRKAVKVKEITCLVGIDESDGRDFTTAIVCYKTKDDKMIVLGTYYDYNIIDKVIIDELRKAIDEKED